MEKKKEFVINAFYYGIISFLAIIILYFLYRYCLLIIVSLLASSLIRPLFINIQSFFHIKSKFIKYIVAIFCVMMCYVMIVLFLGITLYVLVQTFYYLPDCIYDIYQQLLTHRYLISFTHHFYTGYQNTLYKNIQFVLQNNTCYIILFSFVINPVQNMIKLLYKY